MIDWLTQSMLQLVLMSVLMVGQNLMNAASERRVEETHCIVKKSHDEQMEEIQQIRTLLKTSQQEWDELKSIISQLYVVLDKISHENA
ncbi:MAG: hypothetical protein ACC608_09990 [Anaerofustis sp.]